MIERNEPGKYAHSEPFSSTQSPTSQTAKSAPSLHSHTKTAPKHHIDTQYPKIVTTSPPYAQPPRNQYHSHPIPIANYTYHVHELTTALATSPVFTVLPAVENISLVCTSFWYLFSSHVMRIIPPAKTAPRPSTMP